MNIVSPSVDTTILAGASIEVSALVSGTPAVPPLAFLWDFDGAAAQASVLSPGSVTFATPGVFTLTLTARDGNSSIVAQQTRTITVLGSEITLTPGRHGHFHAQRTGHLYGRTVGHRQRRLRGQRDAADQRDRSRERGDYPSSACGTFMGACGAAWCVGAERNPARCRSSVRRAWYQDHVSKILGARHFGATASAYLTPSQRPSPALRATGRCCPKRRMTASRVPPRAGTTKRVGYISEYTYSKIVYCAVHALTIGETP